jgi:hypothetical protein
MSHHSIIDTHLLHQFEVLALYIRKLTWQFFLNLQIQMFEHCARDFQFDKTEKREWCSWMLPILVVFKAVFNCTKHICLLRTCGLENCGNTSVQWKELETPSCQRSPTSGHHDRCQTIEEEFSFSFCSCGFWCAVIMADATNELEQRKLELEEIERRIKEKKQRVDDARNRSNTDDTKVLCETRSNRANSDDQFVR